MTDVYISPSGNDSTGNGSRGSPWKTLNKATTNRAAGDRVYMRAGTYTGQTNLAWAAGTRMGATGNPIIIQTDPLDLPSHAIFDGGQAAVAWLQVIECQHIVFRQFTVQNYGFRGNPDSGSGLWIGYSGAGSGRSVDIKVQSCTFAAIGSNNLHDHAVYVSYGSQDIEVSGCLFQGNIAGSCVQTDHTPGCQRLEIFNNIFATNSAHWGVVLNADASAVHITNNLFSGTLQIGIGFYNDNGGNRDVKITNNIIRNCGTGINSGFSPIGLSANCNCFFSNTTNVSGVTTGTNPVLADPRHVSYANNGTGDYHLSAGSPCIAAGTSTYVTGNVLFDRDGLARPSGTGIDIGPYEYTGDIGSDTTPPTLSAPTGTKTGSTTATIGCTTDEGNGTLYMWITTNTTETAANIVANGATKAVTATGAITSNATGLTPATTYYAHFVQKDAALNQSNAVHSASFTTDAVADTTPPALSAPTGVATSSSTADIGVTTNEGNGTMYYYVSTNTTETAATIVASGTSAAQSTTGARTFSVSGLSPLTTYYSHFVQDDASANRSNVVNSTGFTTLAPSANLTTPGGRLRSTLFHSR